MDVIVKATPTAAENTRVTFAQYLAARPTAVAIGWAPDVDRELSPAGIAEVIEAAAASFAAASTSLVVVGTEAAPAAQAAARPAGAVAVYWIVEDGVVPDNATDADTIHELPA